VPRDWPGHWLAGIQGLARAHDRFWKRGVCTNCTVGWFAGRAANMASQNVQ